MAKVVGSRNKSPVTGDIVSNGADMTVLRKGANSAMIDRPFHKLILIPRGEGQQLSRPNDHLSSCYFLLLRSKGSLIMVSMYYVTETVMLNLLSWDM